MAKKYGAPLTGAQMKLLRAAGLGKETPVRYKNHTKALMGWFLTGDEPYFIAKNHPAYTLLNAGWLDGRNVALWFGGDKAPDDWSEGSDVLFRKGVTPLPSKKWSWDHGGGYDDIIAYIRNTETPRMEVTADVNDISKIPPVQHIAPHPDTVTIAKMTEAEADDLFHMHDYEIVSAFKSLGLIKPEPTREERFWAAQPNGGAHVAGDIKVWVREALNFECAESGKQERQDK